ncbi:unnamed protein product, partial [Phaeothamnion confervicola]
LNFESSSDTVSKPSLHRVAIGADGSLEELENLPLPDGVDRLFSWPRISSTPDGVAMAFRTGHQTRVATSQDGIHFSNPTDIGPASGSAMAAVGALGQHGLVATYQIPGAGFDMDSWARVSVDGVHWAPPVKISDVSTNVHDTAILPRADGNVDLYYEHASDSEGFSMQRRCLTSSGVLGPEERLMDSSVPDTMKPCPSRMADGRILLTFVQGLDRDPATKAINSEQLQAVILDQDAAAPQE